MREVTYDANGTGSLPKRSRLDGVRDAPDTSGFGRKHSLEARASIERRGRFACVLGTSETPWQGEPEPAGVRETERILGDTGIAMIDTPDPCVGRPTFSRWASSRWWL